ncbi:formate dehydrogenase subunit gamma [Pseudooceanicola sp. LIPI14-2-Ac024]|uniref:formate dehydrogenase subunit gamma n=1 Tax=Pseudooceanicola sp. LIPI14-2-Ac024 TaxID=3344875 RepID=UPI0035D075FB
MPHTPPADADIDRIIADHAQMEGPVLPILHALVAAFDHVPAAAVDRIARALNLGRAEVHGVVSFYHDFRTEPAGRRVLRVCRAEACQAQGGAALEAAAQRLTGLDWGETSADGAVTLEPVYCLGLCACGPAVQVDGVLHGRVDAARLDALMEEGA